MKILNHIYLNSPIWLQNIMCSLKGYMIAKRRYNRKFYQELHNYEHGVYKKEDLLRSLIESANTTLYYKNLFMQYDLNLNASDMFAEIKKLPILKREDIINNYAFIINKNYHDKTYLLGTSGTTGTGLVFPCSYERERKQWAIWWRYRRKLGVNISTWCGWFGGQVVVPIKNKQAPFWRFNYPGKQIMFSAFHLTPQTIESYHAQIVLKRITWIHGHAHNITYLSSLIFEHKLPVINTVTVITTGADSLFQWQRKIISQVFPKAIIRQHYGLSEAVANISETSDGNLIVDDDFAYVEFIPISKEQPNLCRIIGTGYHNQPFPLVRYDTGDLATVETDKHGNYKIIQIDGRSIECIRLPDGRRISSTSMTNFEFTTKVKEVQFYQKDLNNIYVRIVRREDYDDYEEQKVIVSIRERLPSDVKLHIEYVDKIERLPSGKIKYIISDLK